MTLRTDIEAVRANAALTDAQKRQQVYALKGAAFVTQLTPFVGQVITRGIYTLTILRAPRFLPDGRLELYIRLTKNGVQVPLKLPIYYVNPPILVPDVTPGTFKEDLVEAARTFLTGLA